MEEDDYSFDKMCRVCLTEEGEMVSLLTASSEIQIEDLNNLVMLDDILSYVIHSEVFFINGPYLMCSNCATEAEAAYKFKRRCEEASTMLRDYGLASCTKEYFARQKTTSLCDSVLLNSRNNTTNYRDLTDTNFEVDSIKSEESYDEVTVEEVDITKSIKEESLLSQRDHLLAKKEEKSVRLIVSGSDKSVATNNDVKNIEDGPTEDCWKDFNKILCPICGFKKSRSAFYEHMLRHTGEKRHVCPFCQKRFSEKGNMKVHIRIHTGVHPYCCDVCGKKFIQATSLKTHKRLHDDVKPYKCHLCTFSTRTSSNLGVHVKRHIGIKNYHCAHCEYSAYSKHELIKHMAVHSNNKSYVCKVCGKRFARHKNLTVHEKSHTGEKPHVCELCGQGFTQAHSLRCHLRNIHKKTD